MPHFPTAHPLRACCVPEEAHLLALFASTTPSSSYQLLREVGHQELVAGSCGIVGFCASCMILFYVEILLMVRSNQLEELTSPVMEHPEWNSTHCNSKACTKHTSSVCVCVWCVWCVVCVWCVCVCEWCVVHVCVCVCLYDNHSLLHNGQVLDILCHYYVFPMLK